MGARIQYENGQNVGCCIYIKDAGVNKFGQRLAEFKCSCGNLFISGVHVVKRGSTQSCGCVKMKTIVDLGRSLKTHGEGSYKKQPTKEYSAWVSLKGRCLNPKNKRYYRYGGRGIKICERWGSSYENFLEDMGRAPSRFHSIERNDNDGHYELDNCHWALPKEQSNNRSSNVKCFFRGETMNQKQLAEKYDVDYYKLRRRMRKGMSVDASMYDILPSRLIPYAFGFIG
jgi:hypothetical protein